jgi:hypothetical protein
MEWHTTLVLWDEVSTPISGGANGDYDRTPVTILPTADLEELLRRSQALRAHMTESHGRELYICLVCEMTSRDGSKHEDGCEVEEYDRFIASLDTPAPGEKGEG